MSAELKELAQRLLDTALQYRDLANKEGIHGAVIWLTGMDGEMVIVTRGEYREQLLSNIIERGPSVGFSPEDPTR